MNIINYLKKKQQARSFELPGFHLVDLFNPYYISRKTIYDFVKQAGDNTRGGNFRLWMW